MILEKFILINGEFKTMKFKKSIILLVLVIFIFGVANVCASDVNDMLLASENTGQMVLSAGNEITVDALQINEENDTLTQANNYESLGVETDAGVLGADEEGNYSDLRKDIENGGNLTKSYYRYNTGDGNTIEITNPLMLINGNGAIIDMAGSPTMRVFNVNSSGVTIKNLTIKNANYSGNGGAIYFASLGTVENCNFINNSAQLGGAINMDSGSVTNCNFTDNIAYTNGGALYMYFNANVTDCNFINNSANQSGGALYVYNAFSNSEIDSTFINNSAKNGGAIFFNDEVNNAVIDSIFTANNAERAGGAIFVRGQSANNDFSSEFYDNRANKASGGAMFFYNLAESNSFEGIFADNYALYGGAVFFYKPANDNEFNADFTSNVAKSCGGAMFFYSTTDNNSFAGCFINNSALGQVDDSVGNGGAITFKNTSSNSVFTCDFINNTAALNGGGVNYRQTPYNITFDSNFINNTSPRGGGVNFFVSFENVVFNGEFIANSANIGGAIAARKGIIENVSFKNNRAEKGGAVFLGIGGTVSNCNFTDNKASGSGGAILAVNAINILNSVFVNNSAANFGGAVYINNTFSDSKISSTFINNSAKNGGAIFFTGDVSNAVINSNFTGNNAERAGGALYVFGQSTNNNFTSEFYDNRANKASGGAMFFYNLAESNSFEGIFADNYALYGGGIFFYNKANDNKFDSNFTSNVAKSCGGAIFFYNTTNNDSFAGCFINNSALGEVYEIVGNGGAITFKDTSTNCVFTCDFINNTAALNGGGVNYRQTPHNITFNSNFINNTSPRGGGVNFFKSFENVVFNGEFIANSANKGGAIAARDGIIENVSFKDNRAEYGGAVYVESGEIMNCNFANNNASDYGGAIIINGTGAVINCNFTKNIAEFGGAIGFEENATLINCNFVNNSADTGGAINCDEDITLINCNFDGNSAIRGSAICLNEYSSSNVIFNSSFLNNKANANDTAPFNVTINDNSIEIVFMGQDNLINAIYSQNDVVFSNVTYWGAEGITNTDTFTPSRSNRESGQNITVIGIVNGNIINTTKVTDENGTIVLDGVAGNYWIVVRHDLDSYYTEAEKIISQNMTFNVNVTSQSTNNKTVNITAESNIFNEFIPDTLLFVLPDGTEINATYAAKGTWWAEHTFGNYGVYQVSASYSGLDNLTVSNGTVNITKADSTITLDDIVMNYGESINVTVITTGAIGITAEIDGNDVDVNNFTIPISGLAVGNYTLTVTTIADGDHNSVNKTVSVIVNEHAVVSAPDVTKYYKGSERFVVTVTDSKNNPLANQSVIISVNGVNYTRTTDANGTASIAISLVSGQYNVTTIVDNDTVYSTITVLPTVNATDLVKVFRNGTQFYATFKDSQGNYLAEGTTVRFNINGVIYDRNVSGDKGLVRLNINLEQGQYVITSMNPETGENASNNVTVISRLVENDDLVKYYRNASQYTVKVIGDDGKAVGAGETVTFNVNGVFYNRTTNESGIAKLNINLQPGDYIITAEYKDCRVSNNITVLPVLSADDLNKKYGTPDQFVATLLDGQGKAFAGETVQFNVNGVLYDRVTDDNGQAKLNINLQPGKYIITSMYSNGATISNNITIA